jgi:hypothetical protein
MFLFLNVAEVLHPGFMQGSPGTAKSKEQENYRIFFNIFFAAPSSHNQSPLSGKNVKFREGT